VYKIALCMKQVCHNQNAQCKSGCTNTRQVCEANQRLLDTNAAIAKKAGVGTAAFSHGINNCSGQQYDCEENCEHNCMADYAMCFHSCGGRVNEHRVCVYGCNRGN